MQLNLIWQREGVNESEWVAHFRLKFAHMLLQMNISRIPSFNLMQLPITFCLNTNDYNPKKK